MAIIHLMCGSTGAGKSTYAIKLASDENLIRFTLDEWMQTLFGSDWPEDITFDWAMERVNRCEEQLWKVVTELLRQDQSVVLEIAMSTRALRDKQYARAKASGVETRLHYLDIDSEIRRERVRLRNQQQGESYAMQVTDGMFDFVEDMFEAPSAEELSGAVVVRE